MSDLIMSLSEVMRAELDSLNSIAHNTSNSTTVGYRSQRTVLDGTAFAERLNGNSDASLLKQRLSSANGALNITGQATDMAVRGSGWFKVRTETGFAITRNGNFKVSEQGFLVTQEGHIVQTDQGDFLVPTQRWTLAANGNVIVEGAVFAQLAIVEAPATEEVQALGKHLYRAARLEMANANNVVVQGALEGANVDMAGDMVRLMEATRHIETLQRSMSAYDQLLNTGINQLGK